MQCIQLRRGDPPVTTVDVVLSGSFHHSYTSVVIDGITYASAQTVKVKKGTSATVMVSGATFTYNCEIVLNGTTVAKGSQTSGARYTFTMTDNCSISFTKISGALPYYKAVITMPAT